MEEKDDLSSKAQALFDAIQQKGGSGMNWDLIGVTGSTANPSVFWDASQELVHKGLVVSSNGPSGSLQLPSLDAQYRPHSYPAGLGAFNYPPASFAPGKPNFAGTKDEASLYDLMQTQLDGPWRKQLDLYPGVFSRSANRKWSATQGKWSVPDFVVATVKTFDFVPGVDMEFITIEAKPHYAVNVEAVFEATAHLRRANRAYLALHVPDEITDPKMTRAMEIIIEECIHQGIGLIRMHDPRNILYWTNVLPAVHRPTRPDALDTAMRELLSKEEKAELTKLLNKAKSNGGANGAN